MWPKHAVGRSCRTRAEAKHEGHSPRDTEIASPDGPVGGYLEQAGVTVRRNHPSEVFARFVAGGTLLLDRGLLRSLGDFRRVRRFVDAQLLAGVEAAGGRIYRTHGLGYVLRRTGGGHTWMRDVEEFRRPEIVETEWPGFSPSRAMEVPGPDLPRREP